MTLSRIGTTVLIALALLVFLASCQSLALSGARKYKTDLLNALLNVQDEIEKDGAVSDRSVEKLEKVMAKYEPEYGKKGSFHYAQEVMRLLKEVKEKPTTDAFMIYNNIKLQITNCGEMLKTEVE